MRNKHLRHSLAILSCTCVLAGIGAGCGRSTTSDAGSVLSGKPSVASTTTNSFKAVASHLDAGGDFYLYMGTKQWTEDLSSKMGDLRKVFTSLPNMPDSDRAGVEKVFDVLTALVKASGLEDVSGVGASGVQVAPGMYHNKFLVHHYPGKSQGLLWNLFGKEPHALAGLDYLPETTALATFSDLDLSLLWTTVRAQADQAGIPEISQGLQQLAAGVQMALGLSMDDLMKSLGGEVGFVLTLDSGKVVSLPMPMGKLEISEPAIALMLKVKDDTIFDRVDKLMQQANPKMVKTDKGGLKMRTVDLPMPVPFTLRPSIARSGDYLFLASSDKLVADLVGAKDGSVKGLRKNDEFKKIAKGIPLEGNSFSYLSPEVSRTVGHIMETVAFSQAQSGRSDGGAELLQKLTSGNESFTFSVGSNTKEGWFVQANSSQHPAAAFLAPVLVAPAIIAGITLPALAKAKDKAQTVNCVNNLKQIGLAARIYANDHGEKMPKDFESMKQELNSPKILYCPNDSRPRADTWAEVDFANVSYELVSPGAGVEDPSKVFARCKVHNNVCLMDGSVQQRGGARPPGAPKATTRPGRK